MTIPRRPRWGSLVFVNAFKYSYEGFEVPPESLHEASNPMIQVLGLEENRIVWKGSQVIWKRMEARRRNESYGGTCDDTECAGVGRYVKGKGNGPNGSP